MAAIELKSRDKHKIYAYIDDEDVELVNSYTWTWGSGYARTRVKQEDGSYLSIQMHRLICPVSPDLVVDHIDHDRLNNRRSNLRPATILENNWNRRKLDSCTSQYLGVSKDTWRTEKWRASIMVERRKYDLGLFDTEEEAAYVRDQAAMQLRGEFANLNFEYN